MLQPNLTFSILITTAFLFTYYALAQLQAITATTAMVVRNALDFPTDPRYLSAQEASSDWTKFGAKSRLYENTKHARYLFKTFHVTVWQKIVFVF